MNGSQKLDVILKSHLEKWSSNGGPLSVPILLWKFECESGFGSTWRILKDWSYSI